MIHIHQSHTVLEENYGAEISFLIFSFFFFSVFQISRLSISKLRNFMQHGAFHGVHI